MSAPVKQYESSIARLPEVGEKDRLLAEAIGAQIREFRKQLKMTVVEVSKQAGLSQGMLSKIERGVTSPSLSTLSAIAGH